MARKSIGKLIKGIFYSAAPTIVDGDEHPILINAQGQIQTASSPAPSTRHTYTVEFTALSAPGGIFFELPGVASYLVEIQEVFFYKPSTSVDLRVQRLSSAGTGGTQSAGTVVRHKTSDGAPQATNRLYTVAPTGGAALVANLVRVNPVTSADILAWTFGDNTSGEEPVYIASGESFAIRTDVAATVYGYVRWCEEAA